MSDRRHSVERNDIIQLVPTREWGGCLAVVDDRRSWGVECRVLVPHEQGKTARVFLRVPWEDFETVGAKVVFAPTRPDEESTG